MFDVILNFALCGGACDVPCLSGEQANLYAIPVTFREHGFQKYIIVLSNRDIDGNKRIRWNIRVICIEYFINNLRS